LSITPGTEASRLVARFAYELKSMGAMHPLIAMPLARLRGHGTIVDRDTELVIEGFPRSANSFVVAAFRMAQHREVQVAHHLHAPGHVIAAIRAGVPTLVLVREPELPTVELVLYKNVTISVRQALRSYIRYYRPLLGYRSRFVVGTFHDVTTDLGAVIRRVNAHYGTTFAEFDHSQENERACFQVMEAHWRGRFESEDLVEHYVGRPSELRARQVEELRAEYWVPALRRLRSEAQRIHGLITAANVGPQRSSRDAYA
jgi:hypothetical protein